MPKSYSKPTYDLGTIKKDFSSPGFKALGSVRGRFVALGMNDADVVSVIQSLNSSCFHKTMNSENPYFGGAMQDVYHGKWQSIDLYIKFAQLNNGMYLIQLKVK